MPWFATTSLRAARRCLASRRNVDRWLRREYFCKAGLESENYARIRSLSIAPSVNSHSSSFLHQCNSSVLGLGKAGNRNGVSFGEQRRGFLGCGDGEEGTMLAKVYEERRVLGYSPEQLFAVVAAVDMYEDFLPWCRRSEIIRRNPDGTFEAELEIGFKLFVESYISHVEIRKPNYIKTTATDTGLFDHLINAWEFNPGPVEGTCSLYFLVDFKFNSPFYGQIANMFFREVASRLVGSFNDRCRLIYGPGVPVVENA